MMTFYKSIKLGCGSRYFQNAKSGPRMTLTKTDIVESVMKKVRFKSQYKGPQRFLFPEMDCAFLSRRRADEIVDSLFEIFKKTLANGEDVVISGFGKFQVNFKWARKGRNPQTGETLILRSRRTVSFRPSQKLREKMNETVAENRS